MMRGNSGNAVLEALLCLPLAMLLLFAVTGAGLSMIERAAARDAIRAGVQASIELLHRTPLQSLNADGEFTEPDPELPDAIAGLVLRRIVSKLEQAKAAAAGAESKLFRVEVTPVTAVLETTTGMPDLNSIEIHAPALSQSGFSLPSNYSPIADRETYIRSRLAAETARHSAQTVTARSLYLHILVESISGGCNQNHVEQVFGKKFYFQEQQLIAVRNLVH